MSLNLIRKNGATITPYDDSLISYYALGDGILSGIQDDMRATFSAGKVTIKKGMAFVAGYEVSNDEEYSFTVVTSASPMIYTLINIVLSYDGNGELNASFEYEVSGKPKTDNIGGSIFIANKRGRYAFTIAAIQNKSLWIPSDALITAGVATRAKNLLSGGSINGFKFSQIFNEFGGNARAGVREADLARNADLADAIGGSENALDSSLNVSSGGRLTTMMQVIDNAAIDFSTINGKKTFTFNYSASVPDGWEILRAIVYGHTSGNIIANIKPYINNVNVYASSNVIYITASASDTALSVTFMNYSSSISFFGFDDWKNIDVILELRKK